MKRELRLTILLCMLACWIAPFAQTHTARKADIPKEELSLLNKTMKSAHIYEHDKTEYLDSLKNIVASISGDPVKLWKKTALLAWEFLPVRADSSLVYAEKALRLAQQGDDESMIVRSKVIRINALATTGIFTKATEEFQSIDPTRLSRDDKTLYFEAGRRLYGFMRSMVEGEQQFYTDYTNRYLQYNDSLESMLPNGNKFKDFLISEHLVTTGNFTEAKPILEKILSELPQEDNLYGMAAFQMAQVYSHIGDETQYAAYLAKAAISDIKGCISDGMALPSLAYWMYEQGELNDAFRYINFALTDATAGNARIRTISIASMLPIIDEAYREKINASRDELMIYFLLVTFLLVISGVLLSILMRQIKKSRENAKKLAKTSRLQETYIGHFITLGSTYANRLQSLQKTVTRKIAAGQSDELLKMVNSGKFNDDLSGDFHNIFDTAFLDIYPDFISDVNALLRPEEQISLKSDKTLSPELRIYAFVRLGIEESTKIAQILNYSVSTVYAYRNRMRNKAIDREKFDSDICRRAHN